MVYAIVIVGIAIIIGISIYSNLIASDTLDRDDYSKEEKIKAYNIDRVALSNLTITDEFGFEIRDIRTNMLIIFQSKVTNLQNHSQPYTYIIKVKDSNNTIYSLTFNKGMLKPNDRLTIATSWIPDKAGSYIVEVFVWSNIDGKEVLAPKKVFKISVKD